MTMADPRGISEAVGKGNRAETTRLTREAIEQNVDPRSILDAMVVAMDEVGRRFQCNEIYVPDMLIAARAMKEGMALLEPLLVKAGIKPAFTTIIGTVQGDRHDIGKNLVAMMWKGANFGVVDLGTDVPPEKFVAAVKQHNAGVVGLSALLTTTMPAMRTAVTVLRQAVGSTTKVVVGGAPITQEFANEIGADAYSPDAASAVATVRQLMGA
jgi:5-methyltetrahydrofolate--homocysteine methyltransferase